MASVCISGNWRNPNRMEFGGVLSVNKVGRIERSLEIPEGVYERIESAIAQNQSEGSIVQDGGIRYQWFFDA
jgi:hypothetical protein